MSRSHSIARERAGSGLGLTAAAAAAGIGARRMGEIEAGALPDSVELAGLAEALGVSLATLLRPDTAGPAVTSITDPHVRAGIAMIEDIEAAERLVARYWLS